MSKKSYVDIFECNEYKDQLNDEEKNWVEQFYKEYYFADFYKEEEPLIKDPEVRTESIRNHNTKFKDVLTFASRHGLLIKEEFMEDASDSWEIDNAYKVGGIELSLNVSMDQTITSLNNEELTDKKLILARFYIKTNNIVKEHMRIIRKHKQKGTQK